MSSIGIRNLLLANRQLQPMPVEIDPSVVIDQELVAVSEFSLGQNYPNPFNPETWIPYKLASSEKVVVQIYDASGHLMRRIDMGLRSAGDYTSRGKSAYWDGRNEFGEQAASGVYYYTICAGGYTETRKMLLLK
ncbi:TPA: T9SS type A sorting domain-containing protein [Candidatus Poribacteria bacterium]|nr:T9SS type A sorting domain-containing protein [Candidatus Poribacteria bacterium]